MWSQENIVHVHVQNKIKKKTTISNLSHRLQVHLEKYMYIVHAHVHV